MDATTASPVSPPGRRTAWSRLEVRLAVLAATVAGAFGAVFLLPDQVGMQPSAVRMRLPLLLGDWTGTRRDPSTKEIEALAKDTEFEKALYENGGGEWVDVSVVLSGSNMADSIHRPERCLPAQGHRIIASEKAILELPSGASLPVTRLLTEVPVRPFRDRPEEIVMVRNLTYYWFVGRSEVTNDHVQRTLIDIRDRLLEGWNQRWAYISVTAPITADLEPLGVRGSLRTMEEVDGLLRDFVPRLFREIVDPEKVSLAAR